MPLESAASRPQRHRHHARLCTPPLVLDCPRRPPLIRSPPTLRADRGPTGSHSPRRRRHGARPGPSPRAPDVRRGRQIRENDLWTGRDVTTRTPLAWMRPTPRLTGTRATKRGHLPLRDIVEIEKPRRLVNSNRQWLPRQHPADPSLIGSKTPSATRNLFSAASRPMTVTRWDDHAHETATALVEPRGPRAASTCSRTAHASRPDARLLLGYPTGLPRLTVVGATIHRGGGPVPRRRRIAASFEFAAATAEL